MSGLPAITARGLCKSYRIWKDPAKRLIGPILTEAAGWMPGLVGGALQRIAHTAYRDFFALQDVSFEVKRGEAVGIVGRNGAGKSTLLQVIAGTLQPTSGTIEVRGRVAALLELGAGFNPEFTGRENVFLSGAVLGLSQAEVERRFDDIAAFADIGDFIEQPVKTYSSGMMMRLAFAVNTCVDPEILIVDEALSVGDAPFQSKCFRRLRQLIDGGVSLLFVSHDLSTVRSICSRALWLKQGRTEMWGEAKEVARSYERFCWQEQGIPFVGQTAPEVAAASSKPASTSAGQILSATSGAFTRRTARERIGTGAVRLLNCLLVSTDGMQVETIAFDQEADWHLLISAPAAVDSDVVIGLAIFDVKGDRIAGVQNVHENLRLKLPPGGSVMARIRMHFPFTAGKYTARVTLLGFQDGQRLVQGMYDFNRSIIWEQVSDAAFFEVSYHAPFPIAPPVVLPCTITLTSV